MSDITYGKGNHIKIDTRFPGRCSYCYLDTPEHRADRLFIRSEVLVDFEDMEFQHPDLNYVVVFCSIAKKHEKAFLQCMADLDRALRIEGHDDYKEAIDFFSGLFDRK